MCKITYWPHGDQDVIKTMQFSIVFTDWYIRNVSLILTVTAIDRGSYECSSCVYLIFSCIAFWRAFLCTTLAINLFSLALSLLYRKHRIWYCMSPTPSLQWAARNLWAAGNSQLKMLRYVLRLPEDEFDSLDYPSKLATYERKLMGEVCDILTPLKRRLVGFRGTRSWYQPWPSSPQGVCMKNFAHYETPTTAKWSLQCRRNTLKPV